MLVLIPAHPQHKSSRDIWINPAFVVSVKQVEDNYVLVTGGTEIVLVECGYNNQYCVVRVHYTQAEIVNFLNGSNEQATGITQSLLPANEKKDPAGVMPQSIPIAHWDHYSKDAVKEKPFELSINDQRESNGQLYADLGISCGHIDDMASVIMEVNTNPLTGDDDVPCIHVSFDASNNAISLYKIADRYLLTTETGVELEPFKGEFRGTSELMYWIK
ncbi:hypothetical protein HA050_11705 [Iodobacter sp. HSC-16F04]|uniref:Uncharacterized protein n=1 Tax=Iodobacter violaceini TaxID=3044271 RepID=A0ABX0KQC5_9NEIS|nr:hypothetical protein [Iodobacter violacea]NHQ86783.1 hypothetical protein [Iodobacter violacea]